MTVFRLAVYAEKGRKSGSWKVAPIGFFQAMRMKRDFEIRRTAMDKKSWKRYCELNLNMNMHWWQVKRIREEFGGGYNNKA